MVEGKRMLISNIKETKSDIFAEEDIESERDDRKTDRGSQL